MSSATSICLLTDFGSQGAYTGQIAAILAAEAPGIPVVDLSHRLPVFRPDAASILIECFTRGLPLGAVYLCVVDPGVGGLRKAIAVQSRQDWFIGPDNGILHGILQRDRLATIREITFRPPHLSDSFHGRDIFAPVAAHLARGDSPDLVSCLSMSEPMAAPLHLDEVLLVDHFGNCLTGISREQLPSNQIIGIDGHADTPVYYARTFCEAQKARLFWYYNSLDLVEIAVRDGNAADQFGIRPGDRVKVYQ